MTKKKVTLLVPFENFKPLFKSLEESDTCDHIGCSFSRTTCHVRDLREKLRNWWDATNGADAPGFSHYERVLQNAIRHENKLYWGFFTYEFAPAEKLHKELVAQIKESYEGKTIDTRRRHGRSSSNW
jgi:hypothetical protein